MSESTDRLLEDPLGRAEGLNLEFKRMEALKSPSGIAREVVSMLNEQGGDVWIGFEEDKEGRAISEQDIPDASNAARALEESLEKRIQPWDSRDVRISVPVRKSGRKVLRIEVRNLGEKQLPTAALDDGPRFYRRSGSRVRPMEWHEVRERFLMASTGTAETDEALEVLRDWRRRIEAQKQDLLGIALTPRNAEKFQLADDRLRILLADPSRAGNRRSGATYGWPNSEPNDVPGSLSIGPKDQREISLTQHGLLTFQVRLDWLRADRLDGAGRRLNGLWLLEYTVSFLRLARALFEPRRHADELLLDFVLTGAQAWSLPQYQPGSMGFQVAETPGSPWPDRRLSDYGLEKPMRVAREDLQSNPDRLAFQLVAGFYDWCKLPPDRIPSAYDRATERFTLTD